MPEPKLKVTVSDLLDLIDQYDAWSGSLHPDDRDGYLERFAKLKRRAQRMQEKYQHSQIQE